ncbi:hypothetical protein BDV29DRAFT_156704 [Aspergillus leporis]|uniref:Uncharacterized protein n=1 Tax=Aspergillus leporis TaxID=41062 RepID=A0A5N5X4W2_9EURO|nr:hypothetical protein BDV29DRAFT_156704 [Aspergillus leporis]
MALTHAEAADSLHFILVEPNEVGSTSRIAPNASTLALPTGSPASYYVPPPIPKGKELSIHPCDFSDAIYPIWEPVAQGVLDRLNLSGFLSLGCHRLKTGYNEPPEDRPPTILLVVDENHERNGMWWKKRSGTF